MITTPARKGNTTMTTKLPPQAFQTRNEKDVTLDIDVYDVIGEDLWSGGGVTAKSVLEQLKAFGGKAIRLRINSIGGDVFDGLAIYNLLRDRSNKGCEVVVDVDGLAASAASVIACAGDVINVAANGMVMIHNAWTMAVGDSDEMAKMAEYLDKVNGQIALTYHETAKRMGKGTTPKQIRDAMDDETYMTAAEAVEFGIASNVTKASAVAAGAIARAHLAMPDGAGDKLLAKLVGEDAWQNAEANLFQKLNERHIEQAVERLVVGTNITPAQSGTNNGEPDIMSKKLIEALGARDEEHALQLITASTEAVAEGQQVQAALAKFEDITGAKGDAALGTIAAWKADHEALPAVTAERDAAQAKLAERDKAEAEAKKQSVLDAILDAGKATRAELELMKTNSVEWLESWLQNAQRRIPGGDPKDAAEPQINSLGELTAEDRKQIEQLGCDPKAYLAAKRDMAAPVADDGGDDE